MDKAQIFTPIQVGACSIVGGPFAATYVIKKNFDGMGRPKQARQTLIYGGIFSLLVLGVAPFLPEHFPPSILPVAYTVTAVQYATQFQLKKKAILESENYQPRSTGRVLGVSFGFLVITVILLFGWVFALGTMDSMDLSTQDVAP